jgi:hypothetical protein
MENNSILTLEDGVIRIPFLVKGRLITPPQTERSRIEKAFDGADADISYVKLSGAQVVREAVIDRKTMKYSGEYIYQLMPDVTAQDLIENDIDKLADTLYSLPVDEVLDYLDKILAYLCKNRKLVSQTTELYSRTSEYPAPRRAKWFKSMPALLNRKAARRL